MTLRPLAVAVATSSLLAACAQPIGPTIQVLPPPGKPYAAFQADQRECSLDAGAQIQPMVDAAARAELGSAAIGTVLGAGLGAAAGRGRGAGIGAAGGAIIGAAAGNDAYASAQGRIQALYDGTYGACMVAHGDLLPAPVPTQVVVVPATPVVVLQQPSAYVVAPAARP